MSDLLSYFVDSLEEKECNLLFKSIKSLFSVNSIPLQRRLYNILYNLCKLKPDFLNDINIKKDISNILVNNIENLHVTSKKSHLKCLMLLVKSLSITSDELQYIPKFLPEILVSLKDTNSKYLIYICRIRHDALELIVDISNKMVEGEGKTLFIESNNVSCI